MPECPGCHRPTEQVECGNFHCTIGGVHDWCPDCDVNAEEWTPEIVAAVEQLKQHLPDGPYQLFNGKTDWFLTASIVIDTVTPMIRAEADAATERALADAFRVSVISGTPAVEMEEFHRRAEALLGREVQIHEFSSERLWNEMRGRLEEHGD